jgi:hypothetical protein
MDLQETSFHFVWYLYVQIEELVKFTPEFLPDPKLAKPNQPMHRDLTASVRQGAGWRWKQVSALTL